MKFTVIFAFLSIQYGQFLAHFDNFTVPFSTDTAAIRTTSTATALKTCCDKFRSTYLHLQCVDCESASFIQEIEQLGVFCLRYLKIKNISFPNNKIPTKWFKPDIKIISLVIDDKFLTSIEANAFNTSAFDKLDFLSLINMPIKQLQSGMFTGLRMLHHLEFIGMPISTFASDLFAPCPVLSSLIIRNVEPTNITLLDLVSSLQPEMKLLTLKHFNLSGQITEENLSIIKILDALTLEDDHITDIAPHSFDSFASTLRFLDLRNNLLKTLPGGVIPTSLLVGASPDNFIFLEGNPFHCSCELAHLKRIYQQYFSKFVGRLYCETPLKFKGVSLLDVELCGDQEITTMNGTSNLSTVTTQSPNNSMSGREIFRWSTINLEVIVAMGAMLIIIVVLIVGGIALVVCRRFKKKDGVNGTIDEVVLKRYRSEPNPYVVRRTRSDIGKVNM